jgi:TonB family protein
VAPSIGATILTTVDVLWSKSGYQLSTKLIDTGSLKQLSQFKSKERWPLINPGKELFFFTDPDTNISLIFRSNDPKRTPFAQCQQCPEPPFTVEMRSKKREGKVIVLVTVTEQGLATDVHPVLSFSDDAAENTVKAVQAWRFKPAIGPGGTPLKTRTQVEITYTWASR